MSSTLTLFVDRSLGRGDVPSALRSAGWKVEAHDDHFPQDAEDVHWLPVVSAKGWIVLTKDGRIRRNPLEVKAVTNAGAAVFILTANGLRGAEMGRVLVRAMPAIARAVASQSKPFVATVSADGRVKIVSGGGRKGAVKR